MGHDVCVGRLLLVEGSPGSGKTTTARSASRWLAAAGARVRVYYEGDPQPADLAWQWWLAPTEFEAVCQTHPGAEAELRRCAWIGTAGVAVAYTKVDVDRCGGQWPEVEAAMQGREPFNGSVAAATFMHILTERWAEFGASEGSPDAADVVVFDGALLQNTLVELVLYAQHDADSIAGELRRLAESVAQWRPVLLRLVPVDPAAALQAVGRERIDAEGRPQWLTSAEDYTVDTPWARARGLSSPGALQAYLAYRQRLEAEVLPRLPLQWVDLASPVGTCAPWGPFEEELAATLASLIRSGP
jgi:hypothetical protein